MRDPFICKLESYAPLAFESRRAIVSLMSHVDLLKQQEEIIDDVQESHVVNVVLSGWACQYKIIPGGRRQIIALYLPGDVYGSHIFLSNGIRHALSALTPVTLAKMPLTAVRSLAASDPNIAGALWWQMLVTLEIQREWTVSIGRRSALERMAHLFCEIWTRLDFVGLANGSECEMPLTQQHVADALGLSPVHVNRSLRDLRATGLIELKGRRLTIYNRTKLAELAAFDPGYLHRQALELSPAQAIRTGAKTL